MTDPRQRHPSARPTEGLDDRRRLLARRRMALILLVALVPVTLVAAITTGSTVLLIVNLVCDVLLAGYVAMLLQIKQSQNSHWGRNDPRPDGEPDVRVVARG